MRTFLPALAIIGLSLGPFSFAADFYDPNPPKIPEAKDEMQVKFVAYDGDPKAPAPKVFQIVADPPHRPSEFVEIGGTISDTTFKLTKFVYKEKTNPATGQIEDISELTVENTITHKEFVLVLNKFTLVR